MLIIESKEFIMHIKPNDLNFLLIASLGMTTGQV